MNKIILHKLPCTILPDSEPLISVPDELAPEVGVIINARINTPTELLKLEMLCEILRHKMRPVSELNISYLLGQRMDRRIDDNHSLTLKVVAERINALNIPWVNVFCPHSEVTLALLNNSHEDVAAAVLFYQQAIRELKPDVIILPDLGMAKRWSNVLAKELVHSCNIVVADKKRDMSTGKLTGFEVVRGFPYGSCLIVDDLCDGGGTFSGLSAVVREFPGVTEVNLAVPHGIFSKGLPLQGIDRIFTTNSYVDLAHGSHALHHMRVI